MNSRHALAAVAALAVIGPVSAQAQDEPRFRSAIDVTTLDLTVVDRSGRPLTTLGADAFAVQIDGRSRRIVSAEWISLVGGTRPTVSPPDGYTSNESVAGGRVIVIVVDQPNIREGNTHAIMTAAGAFVDRLLLPSDRVAVVGLGFPAPSTELTGERAQVKEALARMTGQNLEPLRAVSDHYMTADEAVAITAGDLSVLNDVVNRECRLLAGSPSALAGCRVQIETEAGRLERDEALKSDVTLAALTEVLTRLRAIDRPKTLMLISESLAYNDIAKRLEQVGALAASTRTNIEVVQLDASNPAAGARRGFARPAFDAKLRNDGLQLLAAATGGTVFDTVGTGADFFARLEAELSGYYLLGVESDPADRDGRPHPIRIDVVGRDAVVRSRRQMVNAPPPTSSPRDAVAAALASPLVATGLPVRVGAFSLRGAEPDTVRLLIHAEVGTAYPAATRVVIGYSLVDTAGHAAEARMLEADLAPALATRPSALQFVTSAIVAPGRYSLKLAVADSQRTGSVEHPVFAALTDARGVKTSELLVGGGSDADGLTPVLGYTVASPSVRAYLEAYPARGTPMTVTYEVGADSESPALLSIAARRLAGEDGRGIFIASMPVTRIPPGRYVLRAAVFADGEPIARFARPFELIASAGQRAAEAPRVPAPPAAAPAAATSATASPASAARSSPALPVDLRAVGPFKREEALSAIVIKPFLERVPPTVRADFDAGLASLTARDYEAAEAALKRAIRPDIDSTPALVYLAVAFAAAGDDSEAAAVWQTALVDGSEYPQIYDWLSGALLRMKQLPDARTILEEAAEKWPSDGRFTLLLARVLGASGSGSAALEMLERYLVGHGDDADAIRLGLEWIFQAHAARQVIRSAAEDLRLARTYAEAYTRANGPERALVARWLEFLERETR
jgi:VWFA-related protein